MAGQQVSLAEVVRLGVGAALSEVHTALPAKVTAYDSVTNTVVAQPQISQAIYSASGKRSYEELPEIPFVPVIWPRAGGVVLTLPIEPGDFVWLMFSEGSLAEWRRKGDRSQPQDARRHSIGWPVALPGLFPDCKPLSPADAAERLEGATIFGEDGGTAQMLIGGTIPGIRFGKAAISPVALAVPTNAALATVVSAINAMIVTLNDLVSKYNGHTHAYAPGPGAPVPSTTPSSTASAAAAGPSAPASVASALVKSL